MTKKLFAVLLLCLSATTAVAGEHWAYCDDCSTNSAAQLARNVPPDRFGFATVNVLDGELARLHSFRVQVFYDYEFGAWLRLANPVAASAAAEASLSAWRELADVLQALGSAHQAVDIPSAAQWLVSDQRQILQPVLSRAQIPGLVRRAGQLAAEATRVANPVTIQFRDGSSVRTKVALDANGSPRLEVMEGTLTGPDGLPLPENEQQLGGLNEVGDSVQIDYLRQHILHAFGFGIWLRDALSFGERYRLRCQGFEEPGCTVSRI
ncbi:MAG: hypothetical protein AAF578_16120 [Pseudomonadota bacterium]